MDRFETPKLPKMISGAVMCVDSKAWNQLLEYVNSQTDCINQIITKFNELENITKRTVSDVSDVAKILEECIEE